MSVNGEITNLVQSLADDAAHEKAQKDLFDHHLDRVIQYLRRRREGRHHKVDVEVASADALLLLFKHLGRDIDNLRGHWTERFEGQLFCFALQRVRNQIREANALKRDGGRSQVALEEWIADPGPSPELTVLLVDECESILSRCDDRERRVLQLLAQDFKQDQIAEALDCSITTVQRTLQRIRDRFQQGASS